MKNSQILCAVLILTSLLLASCVGPASAPPTPDVNVIVAQTLQGGRAEIVYTDGRPRVALGPFAQSMKWGRSFFS